MQITTAQRQTVDQEVRRFAVRANCGIIDVQVRLTAGYEPGRVMFNLYHPGHRADHSDWSMLACQLRANGVMVTDNPQFEAAQDAIEAGMAS